MICPKLPCPELFSLDGFLGLSVHTSLLDHGYVRKIPKRPPLCQLHMVWEETSPDPRWAAWVALPPRNVRLENSTVTARGALACVAWRSPPSPGLPFTPLAAYATASGGHVTCCPPSAPPASFGKSWDPQTENNQYRAHTCVH